MRKRVFAFSALEIQADCHQPDLVNLQHNSLESNEMVDNLSLHLVDVGDWEVFNNEADFF
jgi:hypothetical protein